MKYYDRIPENFLLIRLVATRYCNYRCPYCYVPIEKRETKKTMFSHHSVDEWLNALLSSFSDRTLEFYFTGGEPLIIKDCIQLIEQLVQSDSVARVRIDSNLSAVEGFLRQISSSKIRFLSAFHPTQISLERYLEKARLVQDRQMLGMVNFVASKENLDIVKMSPHSLASLFGEIGIFLNVARDFHRGRAAKSNYDKNYKEYVDMLQYPLDRFYMDHLPLNRGFLCGGGKHYITVNRHGQVFSCGGRMQRTKGHGNIFDSSVILFDRLHICEEGACPSIISYSFSCSNTFSPVDHVQDYVERCTQIRKGLLEEYMDEFWKKVNPNEVIVVRKQRVLEGIKEMARKSFNRIVSQ